MGLELITNNPTGHQDSKIRTEFATKLEEYAKSSDANPSDVVFVIGSTVYGVTVTPPVDAPTPPVKDTPEKEDKSVIVDFDYMQQFMKDVFLAYGCTQEQADISSEVLI